MKRCIRFIFRIRFILLISVVAILGALTIWNSVQNNRTLAQVKSQASAGQRARATQCAVYPITLKVDTAAQRYGFISMADLEQVRRHAPPCARP